MLTASGRSLSEQVPERVAAGCPYDSVGRLRGWEAIGIEKRVRHACVHTPAGADGAS
ncbi:hypothetical protein [Streptomyces orinoci]|uniref:Uncharacterized protein n=1 Tax=Streptomyces orinoci TaxID=67339 RepID=A0ABV3K2X0_STRON|nr:hypothetical protein [Streptomyces orinoci]